MAISKERCFSPNPGIPAGKERPGERSDNRAGSAGWQAFAGLARNYYNTLRTCLLAGLVAKGLEMVAASWSAPPLPARRRSGDLRPRGGGAGGPAFGPRNARKGRHIRFAQCTNTRKGFAPFVFFRVLSCLSWSKPPSTACRPGPLRFFSLPLPPAQPTPNCPWRSPPPTARGATPPNCSWRITIRHSWRPGRAGGGAFGPRNARNGRHIRFAQCTNTRKGFAPFVFFRVLSCPSWSKPPSTACLPGRLHTPVSHGQSACPGDLGGAENPRHREATAPVTVQRSTLAPHRTTRPASTSGCVAS